MKKNLALVGRVAVAGVVAAGVVGVASVAVADTRVVADAPADMGHPADIQRAAVVNEKMVKVLIKHEDLRRRGTVGASVFVDTNRDRKGPEYVFMTGLNAGSDYTLARARGWQPTGEPLSCQHHLVLDFAQDRSVFTMGRACLGNPDAVRVGVRLRAYTEEAGMQADWLKDRHTWTRWVARG